jgi:hypothetical protein
VIDSNSEEGQPSRTAIQRVVEVARRGHARLSAYRQETTALGIWLRSHLLRQVSKGQQTKVGRSLRYSVAARRLPQRQEVYRNGGRYSSTSIQALKRAVQAINQSKKL